MVIDMNEPSGEFYYNIVKLIIDGSVEEALEKLAIFYGVPVPRLKLGRVKGKSRNPAVYSARNKTIFIQDGSQYNNPLVILHEFYHHLRYYGGRHRGTEANADKFALKFVEEYIKFIRRNNY